MIDFDYFQIRGKWNAATLNRRAEKLEEAQAAADELEEAGAKGVEIIGVKAGKRETIRGKKNATKADKTPKAAKVQAKKKTPAKRKKTAVKMTGTTGTYTTDYKTEKKAKAAAENIRALGFDTQIIEPAGQLDLFTNWQRKPDNNTWDFTKDEIKLINDALGYYTLNSKNRVYLDSDFKKPENIVFDGITNAFYEMAKNGNEQIILNNDDLRALVNVMGNYCRIKNDNTKYEANKLFMMFNHNIGD